MCTYAFVRRSLRERTQSREMFRPERVLLICRSIVNTLLKRSFPAETASDLFSRALLSVEQRMRDYRSTIVRFVIICLSKNLIVARSSTVKSSAICFNSQLIIVSLVFSVFALSFSLSFSFYLLHARVTYKSMKYSRKR